MFVAGQVPPGAPPLPSAQSSSPPNTEEAVASAWRGPGFVLLAALALVDVLLLCRHLITPDLIHNYPFMGSDSHDWVANGLFYAGHDVRYTARAPLLPLALAGLHGLSALHLFPLIIQLLSHGTMLGLYRILCLDYPRPLAWIVSLGWMLNGSWQRLSLDVMADVPAACLLAWSVFLWRWQGPEPARGRPGYIGAGLFGGLSAVTQQLALLMPVAVLATVGRFHRRDLRSYRFLLGAALFLAPTMAWKLYKIGLLGMTGNDQGHWDLLHFHTDSVGHYLYLYVAFVGLPAALAITLGVLSFCRRAPHEPWCAFVLCLQVIVAIFFVFFYDFNSLRFIVYVFPLSAIFLAEGLTFLRRPALAVATAAVMLLWALPFPSERATRSRMVLWPSPLIYLNATSAPVPTGSRRIDIFDLHLEIHSAATLLDHTVAHRVARRSPKVAEPRPFEPQTFAADEWALYFYEAPENAEGRNAAIQRLGNLLLKRVHYLPASNFGSFWHVLDVQSLGALDGKALYRARLPGLEGSWILGVRSGGASDEQLRRRIGRPTSVDPERAKAENVAAVLGRRPTVLFEDGDGLAWQAYLPFLVDTQLFFVIETQHEAEARRMLGKRHAWHPSNGAIPNGVALVEHRLFGQTWIVIEDVSEEPDPTQQAPGA